MCFRISLFHAWLPHGQQGGVVLLIIQRDFRLPLHFALSVQQLQLSVHQAAGSTFNTAWFHLSAVGFLVSVMPTKMH